MKKAIYRLTRLAFGLTIFLVISPLSFERVRASAEDIVMSEIMYDASGSDSGQEWLEYFNTGQDEVEILIGAGAASWRFFDGANHIINLYQGTSTVGYGEYFIVAQDAENFVINHPNIAVSIFDTAMSLKNSSSSLALSFDSGQNYQLKDFYDSAWGANGNGFSLEKINFLQASSSVNWQESIVIGGTPGEANSERVEDGLPPEDEDLGESGDDETEGEAPPPNNLSGPTDTMDNSNHWEDIIISEFIPNPIGSDNEEWIELHNKGSKTVDLSGFSLQDNSTRLFTFDKDDNFNLSIGAQSFLILKKNITKISLNNTGGDSVKLYNPDGELLDSVEYQDTALEGKSFARQGDDFVWTGEPSPGEQNIFVANLSPVAKIVLESEILLVGKKIILSATESYDPEEGKLDYNWDFGDETNGDEKVENHVFEQAGSYKVNLEVIDSEGLSSEANIILEIEGKESDIKLEEIQKIDFAIDDLMISEFVPNPVGSDENEWIEIYNNSDEEINLLAWQIDDQEGGSKPYTISEELIILPKDFLLIKRADSKITLNNSNDSVRLLTPLGEVWQEVSYEKIPEGKSQAWDFANQEWFEAEPSPSLINIFYENVEEAEYIYSVWELSELDKGSDILSQGVVLQSALENNTSLYLADWDGQFVNYDNLAEVYMHSKNFPELEVGQIVTVSGEISRTGALPRLKIKVNDQIWSNDIKIELLDPEILELEDISEGNFDSWQKIRGTVVKKSGKNIYLSIDKDGEQLVRVYNKNPNKDIKIEKGQEMVASGLLSETDTLAKLTVFNSNDILLSQEVLGEKIENIEEKSTQTSTEHKIDSETKNNNFIIFVLLASLGLILLYFVNKKYFQKT